jgi:hypothetical protein
VRRSKTSEATSNLKGLFTGATSYYNQERSGRGLTTSVSGACFVSAATRTPATIPAGIKVTTDFGAASASFRDLGFSIADPHFFSYAAAGGDGQCGHTSAQNAYSFTAEGDLDGDGATFSLFELATGVNANRELYRAPGFYVTNELE